MKNNLDTVFYILDSIANIYIGLEALSVADRQVKYRGLAQYMHKNAPPEMYSHKEIDECVAYFENAFNEAQKRPKKERMGYFVEQMLSWFVS